MNKSAKVKVSAEFIVFLVFLLLVIAVFIGAAFKIKDNRLHMLRVETRDYAFVLDAIGASPYKINYVYKLNPNITLSLNVETCTVEAKIKQGSSPPLRFPCGIDKFTTLEKQELENIIRINN